MLTLLLVAAPAFADDSEAELDVACGGMFPTLSIPAAGAVGVPTDASIAVLFDGDFCASLEWAFSLNDAEGTEVHTLIADVSGLYVEFAPPEMSPNTGYVLALTATDDIAFPATIAFTTGQGPHVPHEAFATLESLAPTWDPATGFLVLEASATLDGPASRDVFTRWRDSAPAEEPSLGFHAMAVTSAGTAHRWTTATADAATPPEWCAVVDVREADGVWNEGDPLCAEVTEVTEASAPELEGSSTDCGCDSGGTLIGASSLLGALAILRRRPRG